MDPIKFACVFYLINVRVRNLPRNVVFTWSHVLLMLSSYSTRFDELKPKSLCSSGLWRTELFGLKMHRLCNLVQWVLWKPTLSLSPSVPEGSFHTYHHYLVFLAFMHEVRVHGVKKCDEAWFSKIKCRGPNLGKKGSKWAQIWGLLRLSRFKIVRICWYFIW